MHVQLELGRRRRRPPEEGDLVEPRPRAARRGSRARSRWSRSRRRSAGCCQCVIPGSRISSTSREHRLERLAFAPAATPEGLPGSSPGSTCASTGSSLDPLEVAREPIRASPRRRRAEVAHRAIIALTSAQRSRVDDLRRREPAAPGLRNREIEVVERRGRVGVARERRSARRPRPRPRVRVAQVEPIGLAVDLEERSRLRGTREDRLEVERRRRRGGPIFRPVRWPMQSTCGFSIAARMRLVSTPSRDRGSPSGSRRRPSRARRATRRRDRASRRRGCPPRRPRAPRSPPESRVQGSRSPRPGARAGRRAAASRGRRSAR